MFCTEVDVRTLLYMGRKLKSLRGGPGIHILTKYPHHVVDSQPNNQHKHTYTMPKPVMGGRGGGRGGGRDGGRGSGMKNNININIKKKTKMSKANKKEKKSVNSSDPREMFAIQMAPFQRIVRDVLVNLPEHLGVNTHDARFQRTGMELLRDAAERYVVEELARANVCADHANRKTVMPKDVNLVLNLTDKRDAIPK